MPRLCEISQKVNKLTTSRNHLQLTLYPMVLQSAGMQRATETINVSRVFTDVYIYVLFYSKYYHTEVPTETIKTMQI